MTFMTFCVKWFAAFDDGKVLPSPRIHSRLCTVLIVSVLLDAMWKGETIHYAIAGA